MDIIYVHRQVYILHILHLPYILGIICVVYYAYLFNKGQYMFVGKSKLIELRTAERNIPRSRRHHQQRQQQQEQQQQRRPCSLPFLGSCFPSSRISNFVGNNCISIIITLKIISSTSSITTITSSINISFSTPSPLSSAAA